MNGNETANNEVQLGFVDKKHGAEKIDDNDVNLNDEEVKGGFDKDEEETESDEENYNKADPIVGYYPCAPF